MRMIKMNFLDTGENRLKAAKLTKTGELKKKNKTKKNKICKKMIKKI